MHDFSYKMSVRLKLQRGIIDTEVLIKNLQNGNRRALARAITCVESTRKDDFEEARRILQSILPQTGNSIRIGITGVPGVGKSTFIEALGQQLIKMEHKVAVLAVDPSSPYTGGSILGDKTRMQELSKNPHVFIRPSPAGTTLGGVSRKTRESILMCEAAGYDVIIVETVGVGQSEYEVASMVDFFLLLMLPNAGDALQGIKRGILELADLVLVNKSEGDNRVQARTAASEYKNALHLTRPKYLDYATDVLLCSALSSEGIAEAWTHISDYIQQLKQDGLFDKNRNEQKLQWARRLTEEILLTEFWNSEQTRTNWEKLSGQIRDNHMDPVDASFELARFAFDKSKTRREK